MLVSVVLSRVCYSWDMQITLDPTELVGLAKQVSDDLEHSRAMAERMALMHRSLVKWYVLIEGGTIREVADLFGVPKSTLHRWASEDGGWGWSRLAR